MTALNLNHKHILMIAPKFFGYEAMIMAELQRQGATIHLIYENMNDANVVYRAIPANIHSLKMPFAQRYYCNRLRSVTGKMDYVFAIRGAYLSDTLMNSLRERWPDALYCLYLWDSVKNTPNAILAAKHFDRVISSDMVDAREYGLGYCPLFYRKTDLPAVEKDIDLLYICSLHSQRVAIYRKLTEFARQENLRVYAYLFANRVYFFKQRYLHRNRGFTGIALNAIRHKTISIDELLKLYQRSKVIVDYTHPGQNGFTMRTIDSIGYRCKLATNNANVLQTEFYHPNNIYLYDPENFSVPVKFVREPYQELDAAVYDYYTIEAWVGRMLGGAEE